ncbi:double homeobox protein A-like [Dama dama]
MTGAAVQAARGGPLPLASARLGWATAADRRPPRTSRPRARRRPQTVATKKCRRSRTLFTEEQLKILVQAFSQNPYPGYTAKQRLAVEINTEESRIQIWFQNRRARHGFLERPKKNLGSSKDHASPKEKMQDGRDRRCRTSYSSSQLQTLKNAFTENPYPGIDSREQLAEEIGVPESRVQIWFQNRRSRLRIQRKRGLEEASDQRQNQGQDL